MSSSMRCSKASASATARRHAAANRPISDFAYYERFSDGNQFYFSKLTPFQVRAVRSF